MRSNIFRLLAVASWAAIFIAGSALAQNVGTVSNHAVPVGKGAGVQGFTSVAPGTATLPLVSNGASSDPSFQFLPATGGGTGLTVFAIGDLLQANATTTLARLAAVATGNVLISGGVGVVSSWGKVGLTTHVSGILPVANGGTNDSGTAWSAYTPTITSGTGTITTIASNVGASKTLGKTTWFTASFTITTNGTGATNLQVTLPNTLNSITAFVGQVTSTGKAMSCNASAGGTVVSCFLYDGTYPGVTGATYAISGAYHNQ